MISREEMLAIFAGGNIPKSSEWQALINKLYDTAEGTGAIGDNLQQSEALAREVRENTAAVADDVLAVEQAKNDIALIEQTITQLTQRAETAEQNSQTNLTESGKQTTLATQAAIRAEQAANSVDSKVTELVAEGNSQVNRISTEAQLLIKQLIETSEEQQGLLAEPLQLAGQYAETSFTHSKASGESRTAAEDARDETQKAYEKTDVVKGEVLESQRKTEAARDEAQQAQSQVERQIIPVHTDVIRTQQIIRAMTNGIQADVGYAGELVQAAQAARVVTQRIGDEVRVHHAAVVQTATQVEHDKEHIDQRSVSINKIAKQVATDASAAAVSAGAAEWAREASQQNVYEVRARHAAVAQTATQVEHDKEHIDQRSVSINKIAKQVATDASTAAASADDAQQILNTIGSQLITYATNLIRTQSVVVTNYAFK